MQSVDYKQKYLKYKAKYLELKGGETPAQRAERLAKIMAAEKAADDAKAAKVADIDKKINLNKDAIKEVEETLKKLKTTCKLNPNDETCKTAQTEQTKLDFAEHRIALLKIQKELINRDVVLSFKQIEKNFKSIQDFKSKIESKSYNTNRLYTWYGDFKESIKSINEEDALDHLNHKIPDKKRLRIKYNNQALPDKFIVAEKKNEYSVKIELFYDKEVNENYFFLY
jgi:hypothetical protein